MKKFDPSRPIKVAIADDHALFRQGVRTALSVRKDIEMIAEADNGMQLLNLLKHIEPDVILLDIQMPIMDGITTLPEIRKLYPEVKVIILSMHNDHSMISKLMEVGANSYLTKNSDSETIYQAIKTCFGNHAYQLAISSTKSMLGHTFGAAGAIEAAIAVLSIVHGIIPPTINLDHPDPACDLDVVPNRGRPAKLNYVMSNSFGFGGINACVILGKVRE